MGNLVPVTTNPDGSVDIVLQNEDPVPPGN